MIRIVALLIFIAGILLAIKEWMIIGMPMIFAGLLILAFHKFIKRAIKTFTTGVGR